MKTHRLPLLLVCGLALFHPPASLRSQDLPPPQNPQALLQELEKLGRGNEQRATQRRSEALSRIQAAASSPGAATELYLQALGETRYQGQSQDFFKWKQDNQDDISHASFRNAAQLQLCYLLLALRRSDQNDAFAQIPETLAYLNTLQSQHFLEDPYEAPPPRKGYKPLPCPSDKVTRLAASIMAESLPSFEVVQWLQIQDLLPDEEFNESAGDYTGILEKNVKGPLRERKDQRLPGIWDLQITTESAKAASSTNPDNNLRFKTDRLPSLIYGKFLDMAVIGQPNRALNGMMELIRAYPDNASRDTWMETVRGLLSNPPVIPEAPVSKAAATPSPGTPKKR